MKRQFSDGEQYSYEIVCVWKEPHYLNMVFSDTLVLLYKEWYGAKPRDIWDTDLNNKPKLPYAICSEGTKKAFFERHDIISTILKQEQWTQERQQEMAGHVESNLISFDRISITKHRTIEETIYELLQPIIMPLLGEDTLPLLCPLPASPL